MSIIYCELHGLNWDSDKRSECPACENEHAEDEEVDMKIEFKPREDGKAMTNSDLKQKLLKLADWHKEQYRSSAIGFTLSGFPQKVYFHDEMTKLLCFAAGIIPEDK